MQYIGVIILLFLLGISSYSQPSLVATKTPSTSTVDYIQWDGVLDGSMEVRITLQLDNQEASGYIEYGSNKDRYDLLGAIENNLLNIYQYDDYSKIMGTITGDIGNPNRNWIWSNEAKTSIKPLQPKKGDNNIILLFESEEDELFLRPNTRSINSGAIYDHVMWSEYNCTDQNCEIISPEAHDDHEFQWDDSNLLTPTLDINDHSYTLSNTIQYASESYHDSKIAYNFYYPVLENEKFDGWIERQMSTCKTNYRIYLDQAAEGSDQLSFKGDFYISALDDELISGYLNWSCNNTASVQTAPFIYDIDRSKFYAIGDLLRSDFDYAFFLEQFLNKKKKQSLNEEDYIIRNALKKKHFKHYVLNQNGIVFFTDFNILFGRRSILVPYTEIQGFVDNKTVSNYFKKKA